MEVSQVTKQRWAEIELKMKFNSCYEADKFWQSEWLECPVCGARYELTNPLVSGDDVVMFHKFPEDLEQ